MAEVYKAKSFGVEGFEKILVIKRILPQLASNQAFIDMFVHEAKLAVRLSHANIVQVFDLGRVIDNGSAPAYYIAMEYVAGLDVASLIKRTLRRSEALPVGLCLYVAAEIAKGLDHAHRRRDEQMRPLGIVHRDVSPQNVLLSWEGEVKVTDFGIAKARDIMEDRTNDSKLGQLRGKYAYMSPEQARSLPVDARSDIFSLGAMLYEMIAGVNPFSAATPFETLRRVQAAEFPPLELLRQDVPSELTTVVHRALTKVPDERYDNAGRFYEELLGYMYSSGTRFTANDLAEFLSGYRDAEGGELRARDVLEGLSPFADEPERTPVEVPGGHVAEGRSDSPSLAPSSLAGATFLGERREVTALVMTFGERDWTFPQHLRARVKDTLARYGARLIDEEPLQMVSLFGLGETDGRETETAVRCALVLLRQLSVGKVSPSAGVHLGRILLHGSGEPARDTRLTSLVSEAQALARATEQRCAVSATATREVRSMFFLEPLTDVMRAGLAPGAMLVGDLRASDEAIGKFVGRKNQLRRLGEVLAAATRRRLRIVTVQGEQGVGKTRFLYEVHRRLRKGDYNVGFYLASCPPRGRESSLSGLTAMLEVLCGVREGDPLERVLGVEPRLRALGLPDEERNAVLGQLGAKRTGQAGPNLPPLRAAFARMVQRLCEDRLHAFVWDNAHALDEDTLDVLHGAAIRLSAVRAVFLLAMRSPIDHKLFKHSSHEFVQLGELDEPHTAKLVAVRAGLQEAPPELVAFCHERAGGHPLFVEELVKELIETGALAVKDGRIASIKLAGDVAVPRPLRSLLAARVARLDSEHKAALYAAAILGDPVDTALLATMLGLSLQQTERLIAVLEERALIRRAGPSSATLASPMLRESVLDSLPADARRELHVAAASAYEAVYGSQVEQKAHRVAQHLHESGDRNRAADFYAMSGRQKLRSGQLESSVRDMLRALDLCDLSQRGAKELCGWLEDLRTAVHAVRAAPALPDIVARVLTRIDAEGDPKRCVVARTHSAGMLGAVHQFDVANEYIEDALVLAGQRTALKRSALLTGAEIAFRRGQFRRALELFDQVAELGEPQGREAYRLEIGLAHTLAAQGDQQGGLEHLDRANDLADPADLASAVEREKIRGLIYHFTRDFRSAVAAFERGVDLARAAGLSYEVALGLHNMGDALVWLGSFARSHVAFRESLSTCEEYGYERLAAHDRMYLAFLDAEKGQSEAAATLRELIAIAEARGFIWDVLDGRHLLGTLAFRQGDTDTARTELGLVRDMAKENHNQLLEHSASEMLQQLDRDP
jgi:serine/threonine protein kinase/tetratricopeptide (TPR) repeat protein